MAIRKAAAKTTKVGKAAKKASGSADAGARGRTSTLVVVESPAKAKTIKKYLGSGYVVKASVGHVMDLPKSRIGVDIENGFQPVYEVIEAKKKVVADLKAAAKTAERVLLATDPDREGEAIAWHVYEQLKRTKIPAQRILFNEITKKAIQEAIQHPLQLNRDLYDAQQARRVLDRLGFTAKKTMTLAQRLYEGVELGDEGQTALITYMRTDSVRLSPDAVEGARAYVAQRWGKDYIPAEPVQFKTKKSAQDAHEAIRPTALEYPPERVKPYLEKDMFRLYELIWNRFIACQMVPAVVEQTHADIQLGRAI